MERNINEILQYVNIEIKQYLKKYAGKEIYDAMEYSLNAGGKRFRPMLLILTYDAFCKDYKKAIPFAIALECIHTYSLIHDDLPAMDNDDLRRGMPTCHIKFDEATAILAGDALLNLAFEIMLDATYENFEKKYVEATKIIASASGSKGMVAGQVIDMLSEGKKISNKELLNMYENKTGKLILASMKSGAILSGAKDSDIKIIENIAYNLGVAFQIKDDILDVEGDENKIGKPINSDIKNNKSTYVSIHGIKKAKEDYEIISSKALDSLKKLGFEQKRIYNYISSFIAREY